MNANALTTTQDRKPPVIAGAKVAALVPQSLEEAFRVSQAIAASGLAPKGIDKPEQILVAIMAGAELGLAPFQSLQSIAVINGRPSVWGDGLVAIVRNQGFKVREWREGEGEAMVAHAELTRPDNGEITVARFSVADAKRAGLWGKAGPWQQYPQRMLQMRARAWALRDGAADVLRGFSVREEVEDYTPVRDVTPQGTGMRARLEARTPVGGFSPEHVSAEIDTALSGDRIPDHDAATGEIIEAEVAGAAQESDFPGDKPATREAPGEAAEPKSGAGLAWADEQRARLADLRSLDALGEMVDAPEFGERMADLKRENPTAARALEAAITGRRKALADRERP